MIILVSVVSAQSIIPYITANLERRMNQWTRTYDYFTSLNQSGKNITATNATFDNLLVKNPPVRCPTGTYMVYSNMTTAICVAAMRIDGENVTGFYNFSDNMAVNDTFYVIDGRVGIGNANPEGMLDVVGSDFPVFQVTRQRPTSTDSISSTFRLVTETAGNMVDGFGGGIVFSFADDTQSATNAARIVGIRDGGDALGALRFDTGGLIEAMRITSTGNVGIGTTSPEAKLDVKEIITDVTTAHTLSKINLTLNTSANIGAYQTALDIIFNVITSRDIHKPLKGINVEMNTENTDPSSHIEAAYGVYIDVVSDAASDNNAYGLFVNNVSGGTGNLYGIYSNASENKIEKKLIVGNLETSEDIQLARSTVQNTTGKKIVWGRTEGPFIASYKTGTDSDQQAVVIYDHESDSGGSAALFNTIFRDGKVGIGTTNPQKSLHIIGVDKDIRLGAGTTSENSRNSIEFAENANADGTILSGVELVLERNHPEYFGIRTIDLNVSTNAWVIDLVTAYVGIGTSSPNYKLDVMGDVNASNYYINGSSIFEILDNDTIVRLNTSNVGNLNITGNFSVSDNLFIGLSEIEVGNIASFTELEEAMVFDNLILHDEGSVAFAFVDESDNKILLALQVGEPESGGFWRNSMIISEDYGILNATYLTNCELMQNMAGIPNRIHCNTTQYGASLYVEGNQQIGGHLYVGGSNKTTEDGITVTGVAAFILNNTDLEVFGNIHPKTELIVEQGFSAGQQAPLLTETFSDGDIDPFYKREQVGADTNNWDAEITALYCEQGECANANGGDGSADRLMETNISTVNEGLINISFYYGIENFDTGTTDNCSLTVYDSSNSYLLWNYTNAPSAQTDVEATFAQADFPNTLWQNSKVSIQFNMHSNNANEICHIDTVKVVGNTTTATNINVTTFNSEILLGDGSQSIFWNDTSKVLILPGNTTAIANQIQEINRSDFWDNLDTPEDITIFTKTTDAMKYENITTKWPNIDLNIGDDLNSNNFSSSDNISVSVIGGKIVSQFNMTCLKITGSQELCDGDDATGGAPDTTDYWSRENTSDYLGGKNFSTYNESLDLSNYYTQAEADAADDDTIFDSDTMDIVNTSMFDNATVIRTHNTTWWTGLWDLVSGALWGVSNETKYTKENFTDNLAQNITQGDLITPDNTSWIQSNENNPTNATITITNSQVSDFAAGVVANEINPTNATIELGNIGGYGAIWTKTNESNYLRDNSYLTKVNSTIIAELMQNTTINRSIELGGYLQTETDPTAIKNGTYANLINLSVTEYISSGKNATFNGLHIDKKNSTHWKIWG